METKEPHHPLHLSFWICCVILLLLHLKAVPVSPQDNHTELVTEIVTMVTNPGGTNAELTTENVPSQTQTDGDFNDTITEFVTEIINMTTDIEEFLDSTTATEPTAEMNSSHAMPEEYLNGTSTSDNASSSVNMTALPPGHSTIGGHLPGSTTTPDWTETSKRPFTYRKNFIIPILIFAALIFLMTIMIFVAIVTKSRTKRSVSTYNLTPAANQDNTKFGHRNPAYEHGNVADDTDVECSMTEMRMEEKTTNGDALRNPKGLEEEHTSL